MPRIHGYDISVVWTGNRGTGTSGYRAYSREHNVSAGGRPVIAGSSDRHRPPDRGHRLGHLPESDPGRVACGADRSLMPRKEISHAPYRERPRGQ